MEYLSKKRLDEIVAELNNLIEVEYPKVKDASESSRNGPREWKNLDEITHRTSLDGEKSR